MEDLTCTVLFKLPFKTILQNIAKKEALRELEIGTFQKQNPSVWIYQHTDYAVFSKVTVAHFNTCVRLKVTQNDCLPTSCSSNDHHYPYFYDN